MTYSPTLTKTCCTWLLILSLTQVVLQTVGTSRHGGRKGTFKVYIYNLTDKGWEDPTCKTTPSVTCSFTQRLRASQYVTTDGDSADYYYIPSRGWWKTEAELLEMYSYLRTAYPWWNHTAAAGQTRHVIYMQSDFGPGDAAYERPIHLGNPIVPADVNPADPERRVAFLLYHGLRDGADSGRKDCFVCFQQGKDIMLPYPEGICGPLCGYDLKQLRRKSMWVRNSSAQLSEVSRPRPHLMFYAGMATTNNTDDHTGRAGIFHHYRNRPRYQVLKRRLDPRVDFSLAMQEADWCISPLGQIGGCPDRYTAGMMFGCLPIMLNSAFYYPPDILPMALPLEEVVPWHFFSTLVDVAHMDKLDEQLRCLAPLVPEMRRNLAWFWKGFLYTSMYQSYLGEGTGGDAFEGIMRDLKLRARHNYTMPETTRSRLNNRRSIFPCLQPSPNATVFEA